MTTIHIADEDELVTANPAEGTDQPEHAETIEQPDPAESPREKEQSLPPPTAFNIDTTDQYSEWKHLVGSFEIYAIAST